MHETEISVFIDPHRPFPAVCPTDSVKFPLFDRDRIVFAFDLLYQTVIYLFHIIHTAFMALDVKFIPVFYFHFL